MDGDPLTGFGGGDCDDEDATILTGADDILDFDDADQPIDNDCDGYANLDTDEDGVLDFYEVEAETDKGFYDSDKDTIPDGTEWGDLTTHAGQLAPLDTDGDGTIDALDTDSDDDGLNDQNEVGEISDPRDTDEDGIPDYRDSDDDGDGIPTADELDGGSPVDTDGDGIPDHRDVDSDGDGVYDAAEGMGDNDGDGVPNYLDNGSDYGTATEPMEPTGRGFGWGCSTTGSAPLGWLFGLPLLLLARRRR